VIARRHLPNLHHEGDVLTDGTVFMTNSPVVSGDGRGNRLSGRPGRKASQVAPEAMGSSAALLT